MTKNPLRFSITVGMTMTLLHSILAVGSVLAKAQFEAIFHLGMAMVFILIINFALNKI